MEAVLYAARDGALALLPDCFKPCQELEQVHGRFRACGRICVDDVMHRPLWRRIQADFERCGYAVLSPRDAESLFGAEGFWGFSDRREAPREVQLSYAQIRQRLVRWSRLATDDAESSA
jgi:hypothetical protein